MKKPVLEIGNREKTNSTFLEKGTNRCALLLRYNIDELLELVAQDINKKQEGK